MKKVLFAVSLVVNIALAGGLFYTITEMNKLPHITPPMTDIYKKFLILEQEYAVFKCIILQ